MIDWLQFIGLYTFGLSLMFICLGLLWIFFLKKKEVKT